MKSTLREGVITRETLGLYVALDSMMEETIQGERERERNRNIDEKETAVSYLLHPLYRRLSLQPQHVPWSGIKPATLVQMG